MTCSIMSVSANFTRVWDVADRVDQETLDEFLDFVFEVLAASVSRLIVKC